MNRLLAIVMDLFVTVGTALSLFAAMLEEHSTFYTAVGGILAAVYWLIKIMKEMQLRSILRIVVMNERYIKNWITTVAGLFIVGAAVMMWFESKVDTTTMILGAGFGLAVAGIKYKKPLP